MCIESQFANWFCSEMNKKIYEIDEYNKLRYKREKYFNQLRLLNEMIYFANEYLERFMSCINKIQGHKWVQCFYEKIHEYFFDKIIEINKQRYNYNVGSSFIFNSQQIYEYSLDIKISNSNITNTIYIKNNSDSAQQTIYDFIKKYCK